jgi:hypothetical protein
MGFYALNQAISVGQPLLQPNVSGISEGPLSHEGTTKWAIIIKNRQAFAIGDLCTCVFVGKSLIHYSQVNNVIPCKQIRWVSFYSFK